MFDIYTVADKTNKKYTGADVISATKQRMQGRPINTRYIPNTDDKFTLKELNERVEKIIDSSW